MARYTGPGCRKCRREGVKLYLKGERCYTDKCAVDKRKSAPGQHGSLRSKLSEYAQQLREKQKLKTIYGLLERQFGNFFDRAARSKGKTGESLVISLEMRLDCVVKKILCLSPAAARQLVRHNHVLVNNKRCNIPSAVLKVGDKISFTEAARVIPTVMRSIETSKRDGHGAPAWLKVDPAMFTGEIIAKPMREDIQIPVKEQLVVELYSK